MSHPGSDDGILKDVRNDHGRSFSKEGIRRTMVRSNIDKREGGFIKWDMAFRMMILQVARSRH